MAATLRELVKGTMEPLVLSVLARGPSYGYDIIRQIRQLTEGGLELKEGTLYPVLHGLESRGWVESYWVQAGERRERKYYRLTAGGERELARRRQEWRDFRHNVDRVLGVETHA